MRIAQALLFARSRIAAYYHAHVPSTTPVKTPTPPVRLRLAGLTLVFLWFAIGGVAHFVTPDAFMRIVPAWVPYPMAAVLISGALELLGALGILWRPTRRMAGIGLLLLTVAVTPANVWMLQHHGDWPWIPVWLLVARLPLQLVLLVVIAFSTGVLSRSGSSLPSR